MATKKRRVPLRTQIARERNIDRLRDVGCAVIVWKPEDVQALRESWSYTRCLDALRSLAGDLEDRGVSAGWDVLEVLLPPEHE